MLINNKLINFLFHYIYKYNKIYAFWHLMFKNFNIILNSKLFLKYMGQ